MRGNFRNVIALAWMFGGTAIAQAAPGETAENDPGESF